MTAYRLAPSNGPDCARGASGFAIPRRALLAGGAAAVFAGSSAQAATITMPGGGGGDIARASRPVVSQTALADAQAISDRFGGRALLAWKDGALFHETYAEGVDADTRLSTFSMAKSVLGLMFGLAIDQGVITSLDTPVGAYLEEWSRDPRGAITLRQLLEMRSGLTLYSLGRGEPQAVEMATGSRATATALATPLARPPGQEFEYANVNSQIAGAALHAALKRAGRGGYADFLQAGLWAPLRQSPATLNLEAEGGQPRYFAGLDACARDWLRLAILFADEGRYEGRQVAPASWVRRMATPSAANPNYGLHLWLGSPWTKLRSYGPRTPATVPCREPYLAPDMLLFDGAGGQRAYVSPSLKLVVVRIGTPSWDWEDSALPNTLIRGLL